MVAFSSGGKEANRRTCFTPVAHAADTKLKHAVAVDFSITDNCLGDA